MTYKLDDDRRKLITEKLLLECWHVPEDIRTMAGFKCKECGDILNTIINRTYDNDTDMMVVFRKLVDTGKYDIFKFTIKTKLTFVLPIGTFKEEWLFYEPERFCWLVSEWMKEVEK